MNRNLLVFASVPFFVAQIAYAADTPGETGTKTPTAGVQTVQGAGQDKTATSPASDQNNGPSTPQLDAGTTPKEQAATPEAAPVTLESLLNPPSKATTGVTDLRAQMLTDAGKTVGFRGGMAARARVLIDTLKTRSQQLDTIFQFAPLINRNGTIPPVIVEAQDLSAFAPEQIRTANRVYKIEREERFVSVPPTWRDYLFVGLAANSDIDMPTFAARPQDSKEEALWKKAVTNGWVDGEKQADAILAANFNRLTRDYTGMMLYSTLLQQGMISTTQVAESQQTVTGDRTQLMLGDKLKRLTSHASFETDPNKWRPTVIHGMQPSSTQSLTPGSTPGSTQTLTYPLEATKEASKEVIVHPLANPDTTDKTSASEIKK